MVGVYVALLLIGLFAITGSRAGRSEWFQHGGADATRMMAGEWWRAVTALTLHADAPHLLGNALAGALLVTAVCQQLGPGVGLWLVLLAGAGGNALTAAVHGAGHVSVGASTAIFGAVGILAGLRILTPGRVGSRLGKWWVVTATSLVLLALLGTGPNAGDDPAVTDGIPADARLTELPCVRVTLVAQWIEARHHDQGRRDSGEGRRAQGREAPVDGVGLPGEVVRDEPPHRVSREHEALGEVGVRLRLRADVGDGIDQHLVRERRRAVITRQQCDDGREVTAGAVPADREPAGVDAERRRVGRDPPRGRPRVVDRGRELVLRRQTIVDVDDADARARRELSAEHVVRLDVADDPAAAVEEDERGQHRRRRHTFRTIETHGDRSRRTAGRQILHRSDLRRRRRGCGARVAEHLARVLRRELMVGRAPRLDDEVNDGLRLRIERGGSLVVHGSGMIQDCGRILI